MATALPDGVESFQRNATADRPGSRRAIQRLAGAGILAVAALVSTGAILLIRSLMTKDTWDKVDILAKAIAGTAGVLIRAVIAWGNRMRQRVAQEMACIFNEVDLLAGAIAAG